MMAGIIIIGAGECGVRAAFTLREKGYEAPIALISAETSPPYERPPLSKDTSGAPKLIRPVGSYADAGIALMLGKLVTEIGLKKKLVKLCSGEILKYDQLLLATGASARLFPTLEGCLTLRTDLDAQVILGHVKRGARVGIIGGGFIGLELAANARQLGADVTVIEAASRLLSRAVPQDIASVVQRRHESEGVNLLIGKGVATADGCHVVLADNSQFEFDLVVAGVGSLPNTDLAAAAGLNICDGIVVDQDFRTSDPHIFAAGDCCNFEWRGANIRLESWKAAQDQGAHVASAMLGAQETYAKVPWFWSDQYDLTMQVAGLFDVAAPIRQRDTNDGSCIVFQCDANGALVAAAGVGEGNSIAKEIRIFEKLIERSAVVDPTTLCDPTQNLKRLLRAA